ncbi:MAG: type II toxin-antitoxin system RelE/ParE family toxin [Lachnospiraceae bacterium]|nr:type II toxin-antitoxin system RelE/ParE family toxin [Lachnospiraceae bacterium]
MNDIYKVKLTYYAIEQMQDIVSYISTSLLSPEIARGWADFLKSHIARLDFQPYKFKLVEEEPWHSVGIHMMVVRNFNVYYWIDESVMTVWVSGIVYSRQDQMAALRRMPLEK